MKNREIGKPRIFFFQPDTYNELSTPEELKQWEKDMKELVGLPIDHTNMSGTCCESVSNGRKDDCDQD